MCVNRISTSYESKTIVFKKLNTHELYCEKCFTYLFLTLYGNVTGLYYLYCKAKVDFWKRLAFVLVFCLRLMGLSTITLRLLFQ